MNREGVKGGFIDSKVLVYVIFSNCRILENKIRLKSKLRRDRKSMGLKYLINNLCMVYLIDLQLLSKM